MEGTGNGEALDTGRRACTGSTGNTKGFDREPRQVLKLLNQAA